MNTTSCQMQSADTMHNGRPRWVPLPLRARVAILLSRNMDPRLKRFIKKILKRWTKKGSKKPGVSNTISDAEIQEQTPLFRPGDIVRVRSLEQIKASLNSNDRLKGCRFMPEMERYCGTIQRVYKPIERYLNECDYTVRTSKGLVLLENVFCEGVASAGRCDRSCFYFWRIEWLEHFSQGDNLTAE